MRQGNGGEPILIVICAQITVADIAADIHLMLDRYGAKVEQHHIPQASNTGESKHPNYYDSLCFKIVEHNLFSVGMKGGSLIVSPAIDDCLGHRDIGIHVIGRYPPTRQALTKRIHREFKAAHANAEVALEPFNADDPGMTYMSYPDELMELRALKDTVVNIAFKQVRKTALLEDILRATGVPSQCMKKL